MECDSPTASFEGLIELNSFAFGQLAPSVRKYFTFDAQVQDNFGIYVLGINVKGVRT